MSPNFATPWHKRSLDHFWQERLPALLTERLPLVGYAATETGTHTRRVEVTIASGTNGDLTLTFDDIPQPDEAGVFELDGAMYVVVPLASHQVLDEAEISCVGEQLYDYVEARLGQAPSDLPWDEDLARAWLPLDAWVNAFLERTAQWLDTTNWTSRHTHLRRLLVSHHEDVVDPGQAEVACLFESPEGPNMGRVFTIAQGAEVKNGRLVVTDERAAARLGLSASMIPFLEHNDANRSLMGANMMRQGVVPADPEPALVQTGYEPDDPAFWTGRNLLTAFVSWGADTYADGIVISESCAKKLDYPYPAEVGDKLANRQGTKSVVSRVLPDDEMPHLADGTPVELVYSFSGMHVRMSHGQALEAAWGRVAQAEGKPVLAPPFAAPSLDELHARLETAGLPASGMETLTQGRGGPTLERPSLVGWVYWNRLVHLARSKIKVSARNQLQMHGTMECQALREIGAYENLREALNLRAGRRPDGEKLAAQVAAGPVEQMGPPTPVFADLVQRLRVAGIEAELQDGKVAFRFSKTTGAALTLAQPVSHPWLPEHELTAIGSIEGLPDEGDYGWFGYLSPRGKDAVPLAEAYALLVEANERLARATSSQAPASLVSSASAQLEARVNAFCEALLYPAYLNLRERQLFSGRAVLTPGTDLSIDQLGLPDEIAWELFGPFAIRELGDEKRVQDRTEEAAHALDEVMARSWIVLNRAPTFSPTAMLAFRPLRVPDPAIRLHPLACGFLDADFDGDQAAIYAPISEAAQQEAATKLSVAGHLTRDPGLIGNLLPPPEALWGLAHLGLSKKGLDEVAQLAGVAVAAPNGVITEDTLAEAMRTVLNRDGVEAVLAALQRLMDHGFAEVQRSGASISPFVGESLTRPPLPATDDPDVWEAYRDQVREQLISRTDYDSPDIGPQLLAVKVRERGRRHLSLLTCPWGPYQDIEGQPLTIRHSLVEGFTPAEMWAYTANARKGLASVWQRWQTLGGEAKERRSSSFTVLARARRSKRPGIVFARAAAAEEVDPLTDVESRLLVGVPVRA